MHCFDCLILFIFAMGPKKAAPNRRRVGPVESGGEEVRRKRVKRDSTAGGGGEEQLRAGHNEAVPSVEQTEEEEDEIVSEVGIYLLPLAPSDAGGSSEPSANTADGTPSSVCVNRLQFPQQQPNMLRQRFNCPQPVNGNEEEEDDEDEDEHRRGGTARRGRKYFAQYKAQVKHLRLGFGPDAEEAPMAAPIPTFTGGGGIAELLTKQNHASPSSAFFPSPPSASVPSAKVDPSPSEMFTGEGFSQHGLLNYAVGFFKEGRLFLLPVDKTYEMRKPLRGTIEREANARATALKGASSSTSSASLRSGAADSLSSDTASASSSATAVTAPLRIRFARAENDMQRRRREQSSFYKQKLVEQDQWIPLKVEHRNLMEMYDKDINQVLLSTECTPK